MTKHVLGASIATTALFAAGVAVAAPAAAAAGSPRLAAGCVTQGEYREARIGMSRARVHGIFETAGSVEGGGQRVEIRVYERCGPSDDYASLTYRQGSSNVWRVIEKK